MFDRGGFTLRKWNSSNPARLQPVDPKESHSLFALPESTEYTKTLGIEWNTMTDHFHLTIAKLPSLDNVTKRVLISDVGKTFDVLGWFSPCMIKMKIMFQQLWEIKWIGTTLCQTQFEKLGYTGDLSSTFCPQNTSLGATSKRCLVSQHSNFTD